MAERELHAGPLRTGWASWLARVTFGGFLFGAASGLVITLAPFHPAVQWTIVVHTAVALALTVPMAWYAVVHWLDYRRYALSHVVLLGYVGVAALAVCLASGLVVTAQAVFGIRTSWAWRQAHLVSTLVSLVALLPHVLLALVRLWRSLRASRAFTAQATLAAGLAFATVIPLARLYPGPRYQNRFPADYHFLYGQDRPFAPSLARTDTGGAFDARSLAGSRTCGTAGCHTQIVQEWTPSAHRYAAMDTLFQGIQKVMAEQNGPESTRYCGGCHDPISLVSGTKNIFAADLTNQHGFQEGVSCLSCHSIRATDQQGNANYTLTQPAVYLWQWSDRGPGRVVRDFLIRAYPAQHNQLSKRLFKAPEYCAACHKQFIDQEVNRVGWVQLQNQYDNWTASHWNKKGDPRRTVECRECHMPLVASADPAAGDATDYNRSADDGRHRSHRFVGANQMMPALLKLEGWTDHVRLTETWLQGRQEVPEIRDKWAEGPIVRLDLEVPETVARGANLPVRVVLTSNKVGHDYPTGPLDIIQSWVELHVTDDEGRMVFSSGGRDEKNFISPGSFLFKAEPVDQHGNLIDRHNLWEMVGVRYRRALFPGYADSVTYDVACPATTARRGAAAPAPGASTSARFDVPRTHRTGRYHVTARLQYRKVDQFLLNFLLGPASGVTAPPVQIAQATATVDVVEGGATTAVPARTVAAAGGQ
jgi:cytochrome c554/c'-like protein